MNLRLLQLLLLFFCVSFGSVYAQLEASIWYFGNNAGLDFRSGTPVPLTDGALETFEGCATISDAFGNLQFYTDGSTVWDRTHQQMPNGFYLEGNFSSSQSAIIVPAPGTPNIYYVFTVQASGYGGMHYSIVDLTANGGLGDVVQKNIELVDLTTEKLTAVQHANGRDIWVITRGWENNRFYSFLISPTGINTTPVITDIGLVLDFPAEYGAWYYRHISHGYMKASPDGSKIVLAHLMKEVELLDFDNATGVLSNVRTLINASPETGDYRSFYGVEFSPNSDLVYVTYASFLMQFQANAPDPAATRFDFPQLSVSTAGALQLGIDGKMYWANYEETSISVVNRPNFIGAAADLQQGAIDLGGGESQLGLPPFIQSFFFISEIDAYNFCLGDATEFSIGVTEPITAIVWDFGDGNTSTLENPTNTYAAAGDYTVSVVVSTASETKTETRDITISEVPVANPSGPIEGCTSYGSYNLDLPSFDPTFLGTQDPNDFVVSYHPTQADADNNTNPFTGVHSFAYGVTPVYVRVSNSFDLTCYDTTQFDVVARQAPLVDTVTDWTVCDDDTDGFYQFDLTQKDVEIFNGQDQTLFDVQYFASQADADANTNPLPDPYTNTLAMEEVFFRFQNSTYTHCYRTGSFFIEVISGVVANTPTDLDHCDDNNDGQAVFDLTQTEAEIIGTQSPASLVITFHESQADADTGANAVNATNYLSTAYQTTVYVRVSNASDTSCYDTTLFRLNIFDTPVAPTVTDWLVCDDNNDGVFVFDLTQKNNEILGGSTDLSVSYYENQTDAELARNAITTPYQNMANPQTLFFRLENGDNAHCFDTGSFEIQVFDTPTAHQPADIVVCDVDETGSYTFDLSQQDATVLNGQDAQVYTVSYHATELDALNNENPLAKTNYTNTAINETLWVRVQHAQLDFCYDTTSFHLLINPLPQLALEDTYVICPDSPDLTVDGGNFESYAWYDSEGTPIGNQPQLAITELGTYSLTVTETTNGLVCENSASFEVVSSGAPESFTVTTSGLSDQVTLTIDAVGIGTFEYSLDGVNYQTENRFEVFPGEYTIYVRDPFECRILTQDIIAMGYQRFFTPNGDSSNEYWNIIGASYFPESMLYIFDRYGKLLGQISPQSSGWDGTFQGQPMPSSDYWFRYEYDNGRVFTGHFALKR